MGRDKALVPVGDTALLVRVYRVVAEVFPRVIILSNHHTRLDGVAAPILHDALLFRGVLAGITSALLYVETPYIFVIACDMPFATEEAIRYLIGQTRGEDIIIPKTEAGYEPLHAIYNRSCISPMLSALERGRMKITSLFPLLTVKAVDDKESFRNHGVSVFTNVNTEEDLSRASNLIR